MKPAHATVAAVLIPALLAGPARAGQVGPAGQAGGTATAASAQQPPPGQTLTVTPANLERIRAAVNRPSTIRIEDGQMRIYVEVIANWPSFTEASRGYDFINGPTGHNANPMSHQEFLNMVTPRDMYSSAGVKPGEIVTMAVVNYVGQWAVTKALTKIAAYRKEKELRDIRERIDAELAAIKKSPTAR
jgi:hypothetical protein